MGLVNGLKNALLKVDFFYSMELLRYRTQPQYKTLFGGVLSLAIIITLLITFASKVIDTLNMVIIYSSSSSENARDPTSLNITTLPQGPFMVGVELWHHDINTGSRYFDITAYNTLLYTGEAQDTDRIPLQPCLKDHWQGYPDIQESYDRLHIDWWLCLPMNYTFELKGKYSSNTSITLDFYVEPCTNNSFDSRPCHTQSDIDAFMASQGNFFYTIYFLNPLLNPGQQDYLTYYLQDSNYVIFSSTGAEQAQILVQDYTINTDQSIIPFAETTTETGGVVTKNAIKNRYTYGPDYQIYGGFYIFKSPISQTIERKFQKIDEILSYIGGLFGTVAICLFIVSVYNGYSFEIHLAGYLYKKEDPQENTYKRYNFLFFLLHLCYQFLDLFNYRPNWGRISRYNACRQEMLKQLDILYLIKRVSFTQRALKLILEEHQFKGIHLMDRVTMREARSLRRVYKMRHLLSEQLHKAAPQGATPEKKMESISDKSQSLNSIGSELDENSRHKLQGSSQDRQVIEEAAELDLSDVYTSQQEYEQEQQQDTIVASLLRLKEARHTDPLSRKIWNQLDSNLRTLFDKQSQSFSHKEQELGDNIFANFQSGQTMQEVTMSLPPRQEKSSSSRELPELNRKSRRGGPHQSGKTMPIAPSRLKVAPVETLIINYEDDGSQADEE